jgi:hypothetical protein
MWKASIAGTGRETIWSTSRPLPAASFIWICAKSNEVTLKTKRGRSMSAQAAGL